MYVELDAGELVTTRGREVFEDKYFSGSASSVLRYRTHHVLLNGRAQTIYYSYG